MKISDLLIWSLGAIWIVLTLVFTYVSGPGAGFIFCCAFLVPVLIIWLVSEKCEKFNDWLSKKLK